MDEDSDPPEAAPAPFPLHNTYHGQTPHHRTPLSLDFKPLRFTDSPPSSAEDPTSRRGLQERGRKKAPGEEAVEVSA